MALKVFLLCIWTFFSCLAIDLDSNSEIVGSFIVVKDKKGILCLTGYNRYEDAADSSYYANYYYVKNAVLNLGETYSFYGGPQPDFNLKKQQGMKVVNKLSDHSYEVLFPENKKNDILSHQEFELKKAQMLKTNKDKILLNRDQYNSQQQTQIRKWLTSSSRELAETNAEIARKSNHLVFKKFYVGMPLEDALWILKDYYEPNFQFNFPDIKEDINQPFKYIGVLKLFSEPNPYDKVFSRAIRDLEQGLDDQIDLKLRLKIALEDYSDTIAVLYFNEKGEVTGFYFKRFILDRMFKAQKMSASTFIELFKESYGISSDFEQSRDQVKVYVLSLGADFGGFFGGFTSASSESSSITSFLDPRGARLSFFNLDGFTQTLFIHKWFTPKEIKDSFN